MTLLTEKGHGAQIIKEDKQLLKQIGVWKKRRKDIKLEDIRGHNHIKRPMKKKEKKDCMFQYGLAEGLNPILENTDLITRSEADKLVEKWLEHLKEHWNDFYRPQMCIWVNCNSDTDYSEEGFSIDYRDCELEGGHFYKVEKKLIM